MAYPPEINNLPTLYHQIVINNSKEDTFAVDQAWMEQFSNQCGGYWVAFCPDGETVRLQVIYGGVKGTFIHSDSAEDEGETSSREEDPNNNNAANQGNDNGNPAGN
ncbi:hypothetical protein RIF29_15357 [Crotalaria pallida]|uniref:Uncharacterized protein n=1 Tax=Crotalaria pallida TaxID=3830 RepID=A0AAN9FDE5_CROPI